MFTLPYFIAKQIISKNVKNDLKGNSLSIQLPYDGMPN